MICITVQILDNKEVAKSSHKGRFQSILSCLEENCYQPSQCPSVIAGKSRSNKRTTRTFVLFSSEMTFLNISFLSETLNLTKDQINGILKTLNTSTKFANVTIERNFKAIDVINFSIEGILLPLLCLIGLTGDICL